MQLSKKLLAITVFTFSVILGLNPALAQDPVPWTGPKDCYLDQCIGDKEVFDFLVGREAVFRGSSQQLYIDEGLSQSQKVYQRVRIRTAGDERNFGLIPTIIDVIRYSHIVSPRDDIKRAKNDVVYALFRAARACASSSITGISQAWTRGFRRNPIPRGVFVKLQEVQANEGCNDLL